MRIAMLSHLASLTAPTGAERSLALLALGLSANGHEVAVAAPGRWALSQELEAGGVRRDRDVGRAESWWCLPTQNVRNGMRVAVEEFLVRDSR